MHFTKKSNMGNHRQDQAIITLLISSLKLSFSANRKYKYGPSVHNDRNNNEENCKQILINLMKNVENVYAIKLHSDYINLTNKSFTFQNLREFRKMDRAWPY